MPFKPYDPAADKRSYRRRLPHWQQEGTTYFVTFRLEDSLPACKLTEMDEERHQWLLARGISCVEDLADEPDELRWEYARVFNARWHALLDAGHGSCVLRQGDLREMAASALTHFHGERLDLDDAVVMPNHVHALITPLGDWALEDLMHSIKRFSARSINHKLGRKGSLWLDETFDHIVRSEAQLQHYRDYIRDNPAKAGLKAGEYWLRRGSESGAGFASG